MKLLIIDNEENLRKGLKLLIQAFCPEVTQIFEAEGVETGLLAIESFKPDLVMLDVEMEDGTGFDLMTRIVLPSFQLIFVTAHNKYAIEAFKFSAIDYLLKPVGPEALQKAIGKVANQLQSQNLKKQIDFLLTQISQKPEIERRIVLKDIANVYYVKVAEIMYCEADGTYTKFYLQTGEQIMVSKNLKEYEAMLEPLGFLRTHNSFLVNPNKIKLFDKTDGGQIILESGQTVPVSQRKKDVILEILENRMN